MKEHFFEKQFCFTLIDLLMINIVIINDLLSLKYIYEYFK